MIKDMTTKEAIAKLDFSNMIQYSKGIITNQFHKLYYCNHTKSGYHFDTLEKVELVFNEDELIKLATKGNIEDDNELLLITKWS